MENDSLANMAGKGTTVVIKGKEYILKPITIDDMADFESYLRSEKLKIYMSMTNGTNEVSRASVISEILNSPVDLIEGSNSISGVRFFLHRSLKDNHELALGAMGALVDMANFGEMADLVKMIMQPPGGDDSPLEEESKTESQ